MLGGLAIVLLVAGGTLAWFWYHSGAHALPTSVAIERFRNAQGASGPAAGPTPGIYLYTGSGTESVTLPPKSQSEGPSIPGTVTGRAKGCFEFRLDYSDVHWQDWIYCPRGGGLVTVSRAGYYRWNFVAFTIDDTSTYICSPAALTIPERLVTGARNAMSCTGTNDHLSTGPVLMTGTATVMGTATLHVGSASVPAVHIRERAAFSGGQQGTNDADTWYAVATGLPLRGTWSTQVSTPSPVGTSTLNAHGTFSLTSMRARR